MKTKGLLFIGLMGFCLLGLAQEKLPSETVEIIKDYEPTLKDAKKISDEPEIDDDLKIELDLEYKFIDKKVPVSFDIEPISPAKIKGEPLVKLYNGYARLGVGNALVPFGEVYYNNLRSKKYALGAHAKYFNMREVNDIDDSDFSKMHFEVFGKRFWKTNTLDANISFDRHDFNYYAYQQIYKNTGVEELLTTDIEQYYNRLSGTFKLKTTKRDSFNLRHEGSIQYNMLSNSNGNAEHNIKLKANLNQFKNSELYNLDVLVDFNQYEFNKDNTIIGLKPQISTIGEKFRINAGLGIYVNAGEETDFHFYPLVEVKYNVIDDILVPYAGVRGEIRRVNYNSITLENPFVAENILLQNSNEKYNLYAGFRGTLSSKLSFNTSASFIKTEGAYFYVQGIGLTQISNNVVFPTSNYLLEYDDLDEVKFKGELVYQFNSKLKLYAQGQYSSFTTDTEIEAWHRPNLKLSVSGEYNLKDKILVSMDLIYWGEQYARDFKLIDGVSNNGSIANYEPFKVKLDGIIDANLSFEYRYTKRLSAFVKFNNIGGINYQKYKNYPTQGFNVWGGLTYAF